MRNVTRLYVAGAGLSAGYYIATDADSLPKRRLMGGLGVRRSLAGDNPAVPIRCLHKDAEGVSGWPRGRAG